MNEPVMEIIAFALAWVFLGVCLALCGVAIWVTFSFFSLLKDGICIVAHSIETLIRKIKEKAMKASENDG